MREEAFGSYQFLEIFTCFKQLTKDLEGHAIPNIHLTPFEPFMLKNFTHLAMSATMWFEEVRGGSMYLHKHPAHFVSPVKMSWRRFSTIEPSRTLIKELHLLDENCCTKDNFLESWKSINIIL